MASAIEVLKSVSSQAQLSSPIGRLLQKLAIGLDGGASSPQYLQAKRVGSTQAGVGLGTNLILNGRVAQRNIPYDTSTGTALLTAGKTYRLTAHGAFQNFSDGATGNINVQWVDDTNTVLTNLTGDCPKSTHVPSTSTGGSSGEPSVDFVWTVPANATSAQRSVKLRVTAATGTADLPASTYTAVIQEIPG